MTGEKPNDIWLNKLCSKGTIFLIQRRQYGNEP